MTRVAVSRVAAVALSLSTLALGREATAQDADPWLGADKALHFTLSAAIAGGGYALGAVWFDDAAPRAAFGAGLALSAGVGKELLDLAGLGDPSWRDLTWDVVGTGVGVLAAWGIDRLIHALRPLPPRDEGVCRLAGRARWTLTPTFTARGASLTLAW